MAEKKPLKKTSTPQKVYKDATKEVRTNGTLVQRPVGNKIKQHLETSTYDPEKNQMIVTKVPLPDAAIQKPQTGKIKKK